MMQIPRRRFLNLVASAIAFTALPRFAAALDYPARPVRIICGFPPGGVNDLHARLIGQWLSERLGQQFVIENRTGAGGSIAAEAVVRSPPDGHTLLLASASDAWNVNLYDNPNSIRQLAPVGGITRFAGTLVVNPAFPARTVNELIAAAKANPGKISMAYLVESLKALGQEPVLIQGYPNNTQDFTAVALAVKQSGADVMGTYMFETEQAIFARQLRQFGASISWVGSPTTASVTALKLAGPALFGSYAVTDFNRDSSDAAKAFALKYETAYKVAPDYFSSWSYDAVRVLAHAIEDAKSLDPEKLRQAILSIKGFQGAEGTYNFDQNGDGLHGYNVVKNNNGSIAFEKHIEFDN
jgi:hypothetical protein